METTWRLAGFAAAVLVVFALAFGVGRAVGPFDDEPTPTGPSQTTGPTPGQSPSQSPSQSPGQSPSHAHPTGSH